MAAALRVELVQTDPEGSPTPGSGHYAGILPQVFTTAREATAAGRAVIGRPATAEEWAPCCDWQDPAQPISGFQVVDDENREPITGEVTA